MMDQANARWGFWSYSHFDNEHDHESLVKLCQRITGEVRAQSGKNFEIFIDKTGLHAGRQWQEEVEVALNRADVLIPIVTPSYFASAQCEEEYNLFKSRELDFGRSDLIAPIYYIKCPEFESKSNDDLSDWAADLRSRQYADFCFTRNRSRTSVQVATALEKFAKSLIASLRDFRSTRITGGIETASDASIPEPESARSVDVKVTLEFFSKLPQTQKNLVAFLYKLHKDYIGIDDLHTSFCNKVGEAAVGSATELHYRLQVLEFQGFIMLKAVGHRTTLVTTIPEVGRLLFERKLITT